MQVSGDEGVGRVRVDRYGIRVLSGQVDGVRTGCGAHHQVDIGQGHTGGECDAATQVQRSAVAFKGRIELDTRPAHAVTVVEGGVEVQHLTRCGERSGVDHHIVVDRRDGSVEGGAAATGCPVRGVVAPVTGTAHPVVGRGIRASRAKESQHEEKQQVEEVFHGRMCLLGVVGHDLPIQT